ncbi:DUF2267 domain-containing protein [Halalkalicoccus sp. NIPERK01]|uniref:DUF2267 domain-containing protein n=1 Tax=Halalkalicoccus sp. NIPERK01 TaxID=3053469 RepID=UPI00256EFFEB|nr:DUF2267 domain-containing protein [Halalkalicoccus sp. NIPERK01]MDL5361845.1 DUF2267 domain-containing protein [Halalkalicoccus sp. NIPERK01]
MDEAEFYDRVESSAEFDEGESLAITHATLEVLSERIGEGQARDMAERLPRPIAESLTHHHGDPATLSREEFVARIAGGVDADLDERDERVRAVLGTLAEAVGEEFEDLMDQLPNEFEELFSTADREVGS